MLKRFAIATTVVLLTLIAQSARAEEIRLQDWLQQQRSPLPCENATRPGCMNPSQQELYRQEQLRQSSQQFSQQIQSQQLDQRFYQLQQQQLDLQVRQDIQRSQLGLQLQLQQDRQFLNDLQQQRWRNGM